MARAWAPERSARMVASTVTATISVNAVLGSNQAIERQRGVDGEIQRGEAGSGERQAERRQLPRHSPPGHDQREARDHAGSHASTLVNPFVLERVLEEETHPNQQDRDARVQQPTSADPAFEIVRSGDVCSEGRGGLRLIGRGGVGERVDRRWRPRPAAAGTGRDWQSRGRFNDRQRWWHWRRGGNRIHRRRNGAAAAACAGVFTRD